jgi:tripartite-type tricarboxylate transporter receptor subunit TctC
MLGADMVAKSAPDGYTIMVGHQQHQRRPQKLDEEAALRPGKRRFAPVAYMGSVPLIIAVNNDVPAQNAERTGGHGPRPSPTHVTFCQRQHVAIGFPRK